MNNFKGYLSVGGITAPGQQKPYGTPRRHSAGGVALFFFNI